MFSQTEFRALTELSSDTIASRARRNQLAFPHADGRRTVGGTSRGHHRTYGLFDCLATILAEDLANASHVHLTAACDIVQSGSEALLSQVEAIRTTSGKMAGGRTVPPEAEVLFGRASLTFPDGFTPICCAASSLADELSDLPSPLVRLTLTNASRAGWLLRARAKRHGIALVEEDWTADAAVTLLNLQRTPARQDTAGDD